MQKSTKMNISINLKNKQSDSMTLEEFCRWGCLLEAVDYVNQFANDKIEDSSNVWMKQKAFLKYIEERYPAMLHDIKCELKR
jgi:hypothetical protein